MPTEFLMSVNEFNMPATLEGDKAIGTFLTRLLLLEPGTIQDHPEMGVGLVSKYRYSIEGSAYELQSDYMRQIEKYLPEYQGVQVNVQEKDKRFIINVQIDNKLFSMNFDTQDASIQTRFTTLNDL